MRILLTLVLVTIWSLSIAAPPDVFSKLVELNKCWTEQQDIGQVNYPAYDGRSEREWISTHLALVEQTLRARSTGHLTAAQRANRLAALDHLNQYWHDGNFPINDQYLFRTPIFIDRYDNFCAVGYLVKATGYEAVSRKIAAQTNLAYVREMNYPELFAWAKDYGFTVDELAWIQPNYHFYPSEIAYPVGRGTDGDVYEMYVSTSGERLYVGGKFQVVDSHITANNIAWLVDSANELRWHGMGVGVNGPVYAIREFDSILFIAGNFNRSGTTPMSSVAWWDGSAWQRAGCIDGTVKDLIVLENELYACGDLNMCNGPADINFVKWTGSGWEAIPGLSGHINKLYAKGNELILGGQFTYNGNSRNIIVWNKQSGFRPYNEPIVNEVLDICRYGGAIHVSGRSTATKTELLYKDSASSWVVVAPGIGNKAVVSYETLCPDADTLWVGGNFLTSWMPSPYGTYDLFAHSARMMKIPFNPREFPVGGTGFYLDGPVHKFIIFKGMLIGGGAFREYKYPGAAPQQLSWRLNGIFHNGRPISTLPPYTTAIPGNNGFVNVERAELPNNVGDAGKDDTYCRLYPNPAHDVLVIENNFSAGEFTLSDPGGRVMMTLLLKGMHREEIVLPPLAAGVYIAKVKAANSKQLIQKLVVQ